MAHANRYTDMMDQVEPPGYLKENVLATVRELTEQAQREQVAEQKRIRKAGTRPQQSRFAWVSTRLAT